MLNRVRLWLRSIVLRSRLEREMKEEMAQHLERSTSRLMARGLPEAEARREAAREFGNLPYLQEEGRYARGTMWLDALVADSRFAFRHFARKLGTTVVMLVVLVAGMSISTLLFTYVHSYAVQPPPGVPLEEDLVRIRGSHDVGAAGRGSRGFSEEEFLAYRELTAPFRAVAGWASTSVLVANAERRRLDARATFVTENYFPVLGVEPLLGPGLATFDSRDPALTTVAVLGHTAWDQLFGRRPDVIGSTLDVNGVTVTVVGVAPERFNGVAGYSRIQVWLPLAARRLVTPEASGDFRAVARLRSGVSRQAANGAVEAVARRTSVAAEESDFADASAEVVRLLSANGDPMFDRDVRLLTLLVGLLGLLVLLVTCTNVSALLTGLAAARRQEIAVRLSLGAPRSRIIRQLLTESALLATFGAAAALGIVWLVLRAAAGFIAFIPLDLGISVPATMFTFGVALAAGVLFGLSPALHATRLAIATAMRDSNGAVVATRARLQRALVVAQVAFTQPLIVLLAATLVLVVSQLGPQSKTAFGDRLVTLELRDAVTGSTSMAPDARPQVWLSTERLLDRLKATPGVEAAVPDYRSSQAPLGAYGVAPEDRVPGALHDPVGLQHDLAAPGYFRVHGIPLQRGREFAAEDVASARSAGGDASGNQPSAGDVAAIVGTDLARRLWPDADPLGRRLKPASDTATAAPTLVVVGVVDDPRAEARALRDDYRIWLAPPSEHATLTLLVRTATAAQPLLPTLRSVVQETAPDMVADVRTVAEAEDEFRRRFRIVVGALIGAGLAALLLSAIGLYAVVAFAVGERKREIAIRIAVGARARQIVKRFVADGLRLSALGLALGLPVSLFGLHTLMKAAGEDGPSVGLPPVSVIAAVAVLVVATAAVWIPARHAATVDPAVTLRQE